MAFTSAAKTLAEVTRQVAPFLEISGVKAPHAEFNVMGHLKHLRTDGVNDEPIVIEGGSIVAISARSEARALNRVTIANGGSAQAITYVQTEIDAGVEDPDDFGSLRTAVGSQVAAAIPANFPIGYAPYPYYRGILADIYDNYELQPFVAVHNQGYLEYPVTRTAAQSGAGSIVRGTLVQPDSDGYLVRWDNATDSVEQIVGRVWQRLTIATEEAKRALSKVHTVKGLANSGSDTSGVPSHLDVVLQGTTTKATEFFRVVINVGL
jgi:hypothetical protein